MSLRNAEDISHDTTYLLITRYVDVQYLVTIISDQCATLKQGLLILIGRYLFRGFAIILHATFWQSIFQILKLEQKLAKRTSGHPRAQSSNRTS